MKRLLIGVLLSTALAVPAFAALKQGDKAPDFSAKASLAGKEFTFSLNDALKKGPVVVYFYPAAFTGGCNIETRTFAVNKENFDAANTTIIGVSGDNITKLNAYSADPEYCGGKFPVASDADGSIAKAYNLNVREARTDLKDTRGGAVTHALIERTTFVITPDNKVVGTFSSADDKISPEDHVEKSLALVKQLSAKK